MQEKGKVINHGRWSAREQGLFEEGLQKHGKEWKVIADMLQTRTIVQIRTHAQKYFQRLAKETGGPVHSTSKKQKLPFEEIAAPSRKSSRSIASDQQKGTKRTRNNVNDEGDSIVDTGSVGSDSSPEYKRQKTFSIDSLSEVSAEAPLKSLKVRFTLPASFDLSSIGATDMKGFDQFDGAITPRTIAAATILSAPRCYGRITADELQWATAMLASVQ